METTSRQLLSRQDSEAESLRGNPSSAIHQPGVLGQVTSSFCASDFSSEKWGQSSYLVK